MLTKTDKIAKKSDIHLSGFLGGDVVSEVQNMGDISYTLCDK